MQQNSENRKMCSKWTWLGYFTSLEPETKYKFYAIQDKYEKVNFKGDTIFNKQSSLTTLKIWILASTGNQPWHSGHTLVGASRRLKAYRRTPFFSNSTLIAHLGFQLAFLSFSDWET